jgi:hypothetical protein
MKKERRKTYLNTQQLKGRLQDGKGLQSTVNTGVVKGKDVSLLKGTCFEGTKDELGKVILVV